MALPTHMFVGGRHDPSGPGQHSVVELERALTGVEARSTPEELRPLDDTDEDDAAVGGGGSHELQVAGRGVVIPLVPRPVDPAGDWKDQALCAETDPEAFFPEKGGSTREAKRVCTSCEVRAQCLDSALANDERFGIWGGLSERERRRLKKQVV